MISSKYVAWECQWISPYLSLKDYSQTYVFHYTIYLQVCMVQLTTKFTKTLMFSGVPQHTSKITRGLSQTHEYYNAHIRKYVLNACQ